MHGDPFAIERLRLEQSRLRGRTAAPGGTRRRRRTSRDEAGHAVLSFGLRLRPARAACADC